MVKTFAVVGLSDRLWLTGASLTTASEASVDHHASFSLCESKSCQLIRFFIFFFYLFIFLERKSF